MSKKRGLSLEEKRQRLQDLYMEKVTVFTLKELEKMACKEKGIVLQTVKDVNQGLIDDEMVNMDKIGISNFFWAFASQAGNVRQLKIDKLDAQIAAAQNKLEEQQSRQASLEEARGGDDRESQLARLAELEAVAAKQAAELATFKDLDPDTLHLLRQDAELCKAAANRNTDNIFSAIAYVKNNTSVAEEDFRKHFGIDADMDYID